MTRIAIESEFRKFKMDYRTEMARNAIKSEFRTSNNFKKLIKVAYRSEMARNAIESQQQPFCQKFQIVVYRSEMARNGIESDLRTSKMDAVSHFVKKFQK